MGVVAVVGRIAFAEDGVAVDVWTKESAVDGGPLSEFEGTSFERMAVGREVVSAADHIIRIMIFAWTLDMRNRIGYMIAKYLSILMATIV